MKLSVTQILLGALIGLLACFVAAWMIFGIDELFDDQYYNENHVLVQNYTPQNEALFAISRCASVFLIVLGLIVLTTGAFWWKTKNKKNLAVTQIIAGALIVVVSAFIVLWGFAFDCIMPIEGGPVILKDRIKDMTVYTDILGLVVLVIGIVQMKKAKKDEGER